MTDSISIKGLDKAEVLAALYNRAKPQGLGFLHYRPEDMTVEEARDLIWQGDDNAKMFPSADFIPGRARSLYFDYLFGRVMKVNLAGYEVRVDQYDLDNGEGAAAGALAPLLEGASNDAGEQGA